MNETLYMITKHTRIVNTYYIHHELNFIYMITKHMGMSFLFLELVLS